MTLPGPTGQQFTISCGATSATIVEVGRRTARAGDTRSTDSRWLRRRRDGRRRSRPGAHTLAQPPRPRALRVERPEPAGADQRDRTIQCNPRTGSVSSAGTASTDSDRVDMAHTLWRSPATRSLSRSRSRTSRRGRLTVTTTRATSARQRRRTVPVTRYIVRRRRQRRRWWGSWCRPSSTLRPMIAGRRPRPIV